MISKIKDCKGHSVIGWARRLVHIELNGNKDPRNVQQIAKSFDIIRDYLRLPYATLSRSLLPRFVSVPLQVKLVKRFVRPSFLETLVPSRISSPLRAH